MVNERKVVVLFGPPGSGKTTAAHQQSDLRVFDRDDPQWVGSAWNDAMQAIRRGIIPRAVVLSAAAAVEHRRKVIEAVNATHAFMLWEPTDVLRRRIIERGRADQVRTLKALRAWPVRPNDCPPWRGWAMVAEANASASDIGTPAW